MTEEAHEKKEAAAGRDESNDPTNAVQDGPVEIESSFPAEYNMLTIVQSALDEWRLKYEVAATRSTNPMNPIIEFGMSGTYTNYRAILSMDMQADFFAVYYVCPLKIIESRRRELARYLAGANYNIMVGHFDLDFRDGEVRFKISVILKGTRLSPEMVKQMIGISMKTMDKFFPGIMACEFGDMSADDALADLEHWWTNTTY